MVNYLCYFISFLLSIILVLLLVLNKQNKLLNYDYLTKLYNNYYFANNYKKYIKKNKNSYLLMVDLKNFKGINDNYGHKVGDEFLILFSNLAKEKFDNSLVVRRSGDEFLILTNHVISDIKNNLKYIDDIIEDMFERKEIPHNLTFNAGIVKMIDFDINKYYENSDKVMYEAKKNDKLYEVWEE